MNMVRSARLAAVFLGVALVACTSATAPEPSGDSADQTAASSMAPDEAGEAVVREWIQAVNNDDREAALALMAEELTVDETTLAADEAIDTVLDTWCSVEVDSVEASGDAYIVQASFSDHPEGTCSAGAPGTSGQFVVEVDEGEVTRIP